MFKNLRPWLMIAVFVIFLEGLALMWFIYQTDMNVKLYDEYLGKWQECEAQADTTKKGSKTMNKPDPIMTIDEAAE